MRLAPSTLFLALALAAPAGAQQPDLKDLVDAGLGELRARQETDFSYDDDLVTTADVLLALARSPRQYGAGDGPFVRRAVVWIGTKVAADGTLQAGRVPPLVAAWWCREALTAVGGEEAAAILGRLGPYLERLAPAGYGSADPATRRDPQFIELVPSRELAATSQLVELLAGLDSGEALRRLPAVLELLGASAPEALVVVPGGVGRTHWTRATAASLLERHGDPQGYAALATRDLAALCRALTLCVEHAPPEEQGGGGSPIQGGTPRHLGDEDLRAAYQAAAEASLAFLESQQEQGRFGFLGHADPGITAMALSAVIRTSRQLGRELPEWVDPALDWLASFQQDDGSIHAGSLKVYVTSSAMLAFQDGGREQDAMLMERAAAFLKVVQSDESEGYDADHDWAYGGIGYGGDLRPDLSNTQFGLEALRAAGLAPEDEAFARALLFLQRCQNDPEFNTMRVERGDGKVVVAGSDGGAGYHPGDSKAGLEEQGDGTYVARSYGSMTYALLKCYFLCGLPRDDPRVASAIDWIQGNYTLDVNPGFDASSGPGAEYQGLFYYYFTMAKALDLSGLDEIVAADGSVHRWREELARHLLDIGFQEGFWTNGRSPRWWEEMPVLATSYALVALDHCLE